MIDVNELFKKVSKSLSGNASTSGSSSAGVSGGMQSIFSQGAFSTITNQTYINNQVADSGDVLSNIYNLNSELAKRNQAEMDANTVDGKYKGIHGMSEKEYDEYQAWMYYAYGIEVENMSVGNFQSAAVSMERAIGKQWADEMAASYDSVLDLVLDEKLNVAMNEIFGEGSMPNWDSLYGCRDRLLKEYGISIVCLDPDNSHSTYVVSMVDENGNVIQDENGKLAQTIKNDLLMPDGLAQRNEIFNSAVLDMMGYDCVSAIDLTPEEYEMIKEMAKMDSSDLGSSSGYKGSNGYALRNKNRDDLRAKNGVGADGKIILTDASDWLSGTYVDKTTGQTTGRKAYWRDFEAKRASGYYSTRINNVTGESVNWANKSITRNMYANYEETGEYSNGKIKHRGVSVSGNSKHSEFSEAEVTGEFNKNSIVDVVASETENETENELVKVKISKEDFEQKVTELMDEKNISEQKAEEEISEKYEIDYAI